MMKKYILSLVTFVSILGTQCATASTNIDKQDDPKARQERPQGMNGRRGPRLQATDNCKCQACEQIRSFQARRDMERPQGEMPKRERPQRPQAADNCKCQTCETLRNMPQFPRGQRPGNN